MLCFRLIVTFCKELRTVYLLVSQGVQAFNTTLEVSGTHLPQCERAWNVHVIYGISWCIYNVNDMERT